MEEFLDYKLSLKLELLGFDYKCIGYYTTSLNLKLSNDNTYINFKLLAPTRSQALKWFRDTYNLRAFPTQKIAGDFGFVIYAPNKENPIGKPFERISPYTEHYSTYEEAEIAAIEKIIEIIESDRN